jgi:hypothetical protein
MASCRGGTGRLSAYPPDGAVGKLNPVRAGYNLLENVLADEDGGVEVTGFIADEGQHHGDLFVARFEFEGFEEVPLSLLVVALCSWRRVRIHSDHPLGC